MLSEFPYNTTCINNKKGETLLNTPVITEFKSIRVLTSQQLSEKYETDPDTINRNYNNNKERYIKGKHYILLQGNDLKDAKASGKFYGLLSNANKFYLWTEKGCLLHAKSLGTDKAWEAYETLVDTYFEVREMRTLTIEEMMRTQLSMVDKHEARIEKLENNMVIDYGQQQVLKERVNAIVIHWLGGKDANAYREMSKKIFSECNHDIQHYFSVNSRNNLPKLKYDDAIYYIAHWEPCNNTKLAIQACNAQTAVD